MGVFTILFNEVVFGEHSFSKKVAEYFKEVVCDPKMLQH
jgi:hypothetical protein